MNKIYLDWKEIESAIESLAYRIKTSGIEISAIAGIPRGGMIPAIMLSHKTNIPFNLMWSLTQGNVLIVDDICDSGETLKKYKHEQNIYTATIHHKQSAVYEPTFWYSLVKEGDWINYPWEQKDSAPIADYLIKKQAVFSNNNKTIFD